MVDQQLLVISFILSMNHIVSTKLSKWKKEYSKDLIDVTPLAIEVYEMDNYIPDVPEQTTGSIAKKPRATKTVKSTMYHSEEFKERYEYFLQMRFEKKQKILNLNKK